MPYNQPGGTNNGGYGSGSNAAAAAGRAAAEHATGARGPLGQGGAPVHTGGTVAAGSPGMQPDERSATGVQNGGVGSNYQGAVSDYVNRSWVGRQINVTPDINRPATFANGISHFGVNIPGTLIGMAAGIGTGLPIGTPVGMAAGALMRKLGIPDTVLGSGSPDKPMPGQGFDYSKGAKNPGRYGPGTQQRDPTYGNPTNGGGGQIAGPVSPVQIFNQTPTTTPPVAPQTPAAPAPQIFPTRVQIPGGNPYFIDLFRRVA